MFSHQRKLVFIRSFWMHMIHMILGLRCFRVQNALGMQKGYEVKCNIFILLFYGTLHVRTNVLSHFRTSVTTKSPGKITRNINLICRISLVFIAYQRNVFSFPGLAERLQEELRELMPMTSHVQVGKSLLG